MDISEIAIYLTDRKIISSVNWSCKALTGGTMSQVYLLSQETGTDKIVKLNKPKVIKAEAEFLATYQYLAMLPKLMAVDSSYRFIVYTYMPGAAGNLAGNKKELLHTLANGLINRYQISSSVSWGWQTEPVSSWVQFLTDEVQEAEKTLMPFLKKENISISPPLPLHSKQCSFTREPYIIHGDCGIHNFIFRKAKLVGVIDPTPIIGYPHYDLIYAFFSSPTELTKEILDSAIGLLSVEMPDRKQLYEEVMIILYQRLSICVKHHPADFPAYLKAWNYWQEIVFNK